jgi:hypothetical protein
LIDPGRWPVCSVTTIAPALAVSMCLRGEAPEHFPCQMSSAKPRADLTMSFARVHHSRVTRKRCARSERWSASHRSKTISRLDHGTLLLPLCAMQVAHNAAPDVIASTVRGSGIRQAGSDNCGFASCLRGGEPASLGYRTNRGFRDQRRSAGVHRHGAARGRELTGHDPPRGDWRPPTPRECCFQFLVPSAACTHGGSSIAT